MARNYDFPPDTSEEEKAIGGILTFAQFGWLMLGVVIALIIFLLTKVITTSTTIGVIFAIPFAIIGIPFAFVKKYNMKFLTYLIRKKKFKNKTHNLINKKQ